MGAVMGAEMAAVDSMFMPPGMAGVVGGMQGGMMADTMMMGPYMGGMMAPMVPVGMPVMYGGPMMYSPRPMFW